MLRKNTLALLFRIALAIVVVVILHLATTARSYPVAEDLNDKVSHILAFATLSFLSDFSFPARRFVPLTCACLLGYGLLIEIIQYFIPYRSASALDWIADALGIGLYLASVPLLKRVPVLRERWRQGR